MISPCDDCENSSQCESPCEKLERLLPQDDWSEKYGPEIPISLLKIPVSKPKKILDADKPDKTRPATIDDFREINPFADRAADIDTELDAQWDKKPFLESDLTVVDYKKLDEIIDLQVPVKKTRRRFKAFLKCAQIAEIARRSNTSKQNIQKQFFKNCKRIAETLSQGNLSHPVVTPHQIKKRYSDLKPTEGF